MSELLDIRPTEINVKKRSHFFFDEEPLVNSMFPKWVQSSEIRVGKYKVKVMNHKASHDNGLRRRRQI